MMQISLFKGKFRSFFIHCTLFNHFSVIGNHWELRFDISKYSDFFCFVFSNSQLFYFNVFMQRRINHV